MPPRSSLKPFPLNRVKLMDGVFLHRFNLNRNYVMSLKDAALLQNFNLEAGWTAAIFRGVHPVGVQQPWGEDWHWGWESPTCQIRGHFLGHWLSAAAKIYASTGDPEVKLKLDRIVEGLDRCQKNNGGEWCGPIPEKYLEWILRGHPVWAPHTIHNSYICYEDAEGLVVTQYIPFELAWERPGNKITVRQSFDPETLHQGKMVAQAGAASRPKHWLADFFFQMEKPAKFVLKLRMPWWLAGKPVITVNGKKEDAAVKPSTYAVIRRTWKDGDKVRVELPKGLWTCPLPDEPDTVAFMDGPVVLAGLCDEQRCLHGDKEHPESILAADKEREGITWHGGYRTIGQERTIRFVPLHEVVDDRYTVYFPVRR